MQNGLKQFGAKATASFNQMMYRSRLTLALTYVMILAVILVSAGSITRAVYSQRLESRVENFLESMRDSTGGIHQPSLRQVLREDLMKIIFFVNGFLLVAAGCLSYWLAGVTMRPVADSFQRQRRFLSDVSHELRTPLAILQTSLENEAEQSTDLERRKKIHADLEEVERMGNLVHNLLLLSRTGDDAERPPVMTVVSVHALLDKTVHRFQAFAAAHAVDMKVVSGREEMSLWVNEELMQQALGNIIKNAILYNKPHGTVLLSAHRAANRVVLRVVDTGIGISAEDQQKVFDRFYRVDKSRSRQTGGSGLGLSIVQSIIESFGGTLSLTSVLDQGTTVAVSLPIHKAS